MTRAPCVVWVALFAGSSLACEDARQPPTSPSPPTVATSLPPAPAPPAPAPGHPMAGSYSLRLDVGSGCAGTLGAARVRTYDASIASSDGVSYMVTLGGAPFLSGPICTFGRLPECNQFLATRNGESMTFDLANNNDDGHGGHIVEQLADGRWIELIGSASGTMQDGSIEASGSASLWYCPESRSYPFPCWTFSSCTSDDMKLTFTRR